jgi:uncharacterized protein with HEPN domain
MDNKIDINVLTWLEDISVAIENIENFLPEKRVFKDYQKDLKTKFAVERNIEIVGEAMSRILKIYEEIPITDARKIVNTRNWVIHGYEKILDETIWSIVINHLPTLKAEVKKLIAENENKIIKLI